MPIFASRPATTVSQRSPWLIPKMAHVITFIAVAPAAFGRMVSNPQPPKVDLPLEATAKVYIYRPGFAFQHIWQEILAQTKPDVRESLHVESQQSGQQTV